MNDDEIFELYVLQSKNVRKLKSAFDVLIRDINSCLVKNDEFQLEIKTKMLALTYCALSEAQFVQIVHTPFGFLYSEIKKIKSKNSLAESWKLMIDLAMNKVNPKWQRISDYQDKRQFIIRLITDYIEGPQEIRNKIAHGQWEHALNNIGTRENTSTTARLHALNVVQISIWAEIHQYLGFIIRDLIQSPTLAFNEKYWPNYVKLEHFVSKSSTWTIEKRRIALLKKKVVLNKKVELDNQLNS